MALLVSVTDWPAQIGALLPLMDELVREILHKEVIMTLPCVVFVPAEFD